MARKVILLSIARSMFRNPEVTLTHAEKTYAAACEEYGMQAKKHTQFYTYVKSLETIGAIRTEVRRDTEGGRTTFITIPGYPPRLLAERLEDLIGRENAHEMRSLRMRCGNVPRIQRCPSLRAAFQYPRRAYGQEGDPQAD